MDRRCWQSFEAEVGVVIGGLAQFVQESLRIGESGYQYLYILDAGIPADPVHTNETWVTCPASLRAQFLYALEEISQTNAKAMFFYTTSIGRAGFRVEVDDRVDCALGVLRSYFTSSLLSPRDRADSYSSIFRSLNETNAVTPDRLSVFVEFSLDLSNLDKLVAHELLARWKRRFFNESNPIVQLGELIKAFGDRLSSAPAEGSKLFDPFALDWFKSSGVNPGQQQILVELRDWIGGNKEKAIERRENLPEVPQNQTRSAVPPSLWERLQRYFWAYGPVFPSFRLNLEHLILAQTCLNSSSLATTF